MSRAPSILCDVVEAYAEADARHKQYRDRGQHDKADDYLAEMQEIERCIQVHELSIAWRRTIQTRKRREMEARR